MKFKLDSRALEQQLRRLGTGAPRVALDIVNRLTLMGTERAQAGARVDSGELKESIQMQPAQLMNGIAEGTWNALSDHAGFVEFGTGLPGAEGLVANGQPRDPQAAEFTYTLNTRRKLKNGELSPNPTPGWTYYDPVLQRFVHTLGQPAQPFMYPALLHIADRAADIVAEAVREYLGGDGVGR